MSRKRAVAAPDEDMVRDRVGAKSFERGMAYFRDGRVFDARRQGPTLKALCEGSHGDDYRVEATLDARGGVASADCSCAVGAGGYCKHVAAMLLTWIDRPEAFVEVEDLDASLERRSKPELIALIRLMLRRAPELETLLEVPTPGTGAAPGRVDAGVYRRQAERVFDDHSGYDFRDAWAVGQQLRPLADLGDGFLDQGNPAAASAVFEGVAGAILDAYATVDDEGGSVVDVLGRCLDGLGRCLPALKDDLARRESILATLVDAVDLVCDVGDGDETVARALLEHATDAERRAAAERIRERLAEDDDEDDPDDPDRDYVRAYAHPGLARFLLAIDPDARDDGRYLEICREQRLTGELVGKLLDLRRFDEAERELARAPMHELVRLADLFVARRRSAAAERVMRERAESGGPHDDRAHEWLLRRATARRDKAAVRRLAEALYRRSPTLERYREVRRLASGEPGWPEARAELRSVLEARSPSDAVRVLLDEGEVDRALETIRAKPRPKTDGHGWGRYDDFGQVRFEVARAAEASHPRASLEIYREAAEQLIEHRGRENYAEACRHLEKVARLHRALGEPGEWDYYVALLRERHRSLRAFQEELKKAKL